MRFLRLALLIGGIADFLVGASVLIATKPFLKLIRVPVPENPAFAMLAGVVLLGVGLMIITAARAPERYHANVTIAAMLRIGSAALLLWLVRAGSLPAHILWLSAAEALLGILHFLYSRELR